MRSRKILFILLFLSGLFCGFYFWRRWNLEESYNVSLSAKKMPEKPVTEEYLKESLFLSAYLKEEKGDLDGAEGDYLLSIDKSNATDKIALFNLGNVYVKKALKTKDPKMLGTAVEYYKSALRIDHEFLEAKYNLDLAMRMHSISAGGQSNKQENGNDGNNGQKGSDPSMVPFKGRNI